MQTIDNSRLTYMMMTSFEVAAVSVAPALLEMANNEKDQIIMILADQLLKYTGNSF